MNLCQVDSESMHNSTAFKTHVLEPLVSDSSGSSGGGAALSPRAEGKTTASPQQSPSSPSPSASEDAPQPQQEAKSPAASVAQSEPEPEQEAEAGTEAAVEAEPEAEAPPQEEAPRQEDSAATVRPSTPEAPRPQDAQTPDTAKAASGSAPRARDEAAAANGTPKAPSSRISRPAAQSSLRTPAASSSPAKGSSGLRRPSTASSVGGSSSPGARPATAGSGRSKSIQDRPEWQSVFVPYKTPVKLRSGVKAKYFGGSRDSVSPSSSSRPRSAASAKKRSTGRDPATHEPAANEDSKRVTAVSGIPKAVVSLPERRSRAAVSGKSPAYTRSALAGAGALPIADDDSSTPSPRPRGRAPGSGRTHQDFLRSTASTLPGSAAAGTSPLIGPALPDPDSPEYSRRLASSQRYKEKARRERESGIALGQDARQQEEPRPPKKFFNDKNKVAHGALPEGPETPPTFSSKKIIGSRSSVNYNILSPAPPAAASPSPSPPLEASAEEGAS